MIIYRNRTCICNRTHSQVIIIDYYWLLWTANHNDDSITTCGEISKKVHRVQKCAICDISYIMSRCWYNVSLILHCIALKHHAAGAGWSRSRYWVPVSAVYTIETGCRTTSEPPTAALNVGTVSISPLVVVYVRRTERHSVWLPVHRVIIVKGVTSVAMVPGHVQRVVVVLWFDGHVVVLRPQPLTTRLYLHFHT